MSATQVNTQELWQAVKNILVFSRKDGWARGAYFRHHPFGYLQLLTSDDYVGIQSQVYVGTKNQISDFWLSSSAIKDLEKLLRTWKDENEHIEVLLEDDTLRVREEGFQAVACPNSEWWNMFVKIMDQSGWTEDQVSRPWEISGARVSKLNLLEPKNQYPISFKNVQSVQNRFLAFRYGPNTQGMIIPLDREALMEVYDDMKEVVW